MKKQNHITPIQIMKKYETKSHYTSSNNENFNILNQNWSDVAAPSGIYLEHWKDY